MQAKHVIATGIILSALLATLVIFEWIPPQVAGFLVLGITLTAAFFIALSMLRGRRLGDQGLVATAVQRIHEQKTEEQVINQVLHWAKALVECQSVFFFPLEPAGTTLQNGDEQKAWQDLSQELAESGRNWRWPTAACQAPPPASIKSFLAFPVTGEGKKLAGILYLLNRQGQPEFSAADETLLQNLVKAVQTALLRLRSEEQSLKLYREIISAVVRGIETGSPGFQGHARRVSYLAGLLGSVLGFDRRETSELTLAALIHDVGKIVPDPVDEGEATASQSDDRHPQKGAMLLPDEESFARMREAILYHHERYNGSGFPEGLRMADIPLSAGIIAVADVFDALTCLSEEEARMSHEEALAVIKKATGTLFDPMVVVALEEIMPVLLSGDEKRMFD